MAADDFYADPFKGDGILIVDKPTERTWVYHEAERDAWHFCKVQPVGAILDENRRKLNASAGQRWGDMTHVASIPNSMFWHGDFAKAHADQDEAWITRYLNNSDNKKLRTREGNI